MAALVAVMIMVSIGTFSWASIRNLREHPQLQRGDAGHGGRGGATHDLAKGVLVGVLLSGFFFAHKVGISCTWLAREDEGRQRTYGVMSARCSSPRPNASSAPSTSRK
jgi:SulP family sulfate permease